MEWRFVSRTVIVLLAIAAVIVAILAPIPSPPEAGAASPDGFRDELIQSGLKWPTGVEFAPDGRVFIAEREGIVSVLDSLDDSTRRTIINIRLNVHVDGDRGMLGMAYRADGNREWIYVLYTYDAPPGGTAPTWGKTNPSERGWEGCDVKGECITQGRLSRFELMSDGTTGPEEVLIQEWCSQFGNHSIGDLQFADDGSLYASAGDLSKAGSPDYGQLGTPPNGCGQPPGEAGTALSAPTSEGGSLGSQDFRTTDDPFNLAGTIIRIDPDTGGPMPDNPLVDAADPNERLLLAYGLRNPYRFTIRPGTNEVWIGDVGSIRWEEIDVLWDPLGLPIENFGWPCYEGPERYERFDVVDLDLCESLYDAGPAAVEEPFFTYFHNDDPVGPGQCATTGGSGAITGLAFYDGGDYPDRYDGALFAAEFGDDCIFVLMPGPDGNPDPNRIEVFLSPAENVIDLVVGPGGDLFYTTLQGELHRLSYEGAATQLEARVSASPSSGAAPLDVRLDVSATRGGTQPFSVEWDLDGDGLFDDATGTVIDATFGAGQHAPSARIVDASGATSTATVPVLVTGALLVAASMPTEIQQFRVGDVIAFGADVRTATGVPVTEDSFDWTVQIEHCPTENSCHHHPQGVFTGASSGEIVFPDHEAPYKVVFDLDVAYDGASATHQVAANPALATVRLESVPPGLRLLATEQAEAAPFDHEAVVGSVVSISAPATQDLGDTTYDFVGWSNGGTASHDIVMPDGGGALIATYQAVVEPEPVPPVPLFEGYRLLDTAGRVYEFGTVPDLGDATPHVSPAVDIAATGSANGYIVLRRDGSLSYHGDAPVVAAVPMPAGSTAVAIELTHTGGGFWIFTDDGRVLPHGDATFHGDVSHLQLIGPIVGAVVAADGFGYFLVGIDGGVFSLGSAVFLGSVPQILPGVQLDCPVVGMVVATSSGYWLIACDGGVFAFGSAPFVGSLPGIGVIPVEPIGGMIGYGTGYLLSATDGGAFSFGGPFFGSLGATSTPDPIVAVAG